MVRAFAGHPILIKVAAALAIGVSLSLAYGEDADLASGPGHFTVPAGQSGIIIYSQPYQDPSHVRCEENREACVGFVSTSNKAADIVDCSALPPGACPTPSSPPPSSTSSQYVYVHFSYKSSPTQCEQAGKGLGIGKDWCERNTNSLESFLGISSIEQNSGNGWVRKDAVVAKPYIDPKDPSKKVHVPQTQAIAYCPDCMDTNYQLNPQTSGKIFKQAEKIKQAAVSLNGCKLYDAASRDLAQACSEKEDVEFLPGLKFSTSINDGQCALCFFGGKDFCGDPKVARGRKLEDLSALLVRRSELLCRLAQQQFESNCGVWKASGTVEERRDATFKTLKNQIKSFEPSDEKKSRALRFPLMACLLNAENNLFDPNRPTSMTCDAKRYAAAQHAAFNQFVSMLARHHLPKSKAKDYLKSCVALKDVANLMQACENVAQFLSLTDPTQKKTSEVIIPAIRSYYAHSSSAAGLTMLVRSTTRWLYGDPDSKGNPGPPILKNYCQDFASYWSHMDVSKSDAFFPRHPCEEAANGDALFEKMSDDPTLQLMMGIKLFNYYLNDSRSSVYAALEKWFGQRNPVIPGVTACASCAARHGSDISSCLSLTTTSYGRSSSSRKAEK